MADEPVVEEDHARGFTQDCGQIILFFQVSDLGSGTKRSEEQ